MLSFLKLSIKSKIIFLIVVVNTINTIFLTITQYYSQKHEFFRNTTQRLELICRVLAESNVFAITFHDKKSADSYLNSLKIDEYVENAVLFLPDSSILARYSKLGQPILKIKLKHFQTKTVMVSNDFISINYPIVFQNENVGVLRLDYSLNEYKQNQKLFIYRSLVVILSSIIVATILAFFFQKIITRPIYRLEQVIERISLESDYSLRSKNNGSDEIGKLSDGFNLMIARIENQNNDLKNAKAKSDETLQAKERFLANITHELRTPLSSIIGLTTLIQDTPLSKEQNEYFFNIKSSSDHLLSIINDLLEFSKLGAGRFDFEKKEFNIRHTLQRIEGSLEFEIQNRKLDFESIFDKKIPAIIVGDEFRLNQILINIIGNAIKFTPKGKIETTVNIKEESEKTIVLEFTISDTGIGISSDKLEEIFESFTQESSSTNRKYGGTGLGLSITKQLVELQHGKITVESEKNKGSRFKFFIPFDKKSDKNETTKDKNLRNSKLKVMLVDDNLLNLELTKSILMKSSFEVNAFQDGLQGIEDLKLYDYDVILLDIHMPGTDGFQISKMIRELNDPEKNTIPIIAVTAAATNKEIQKCFEYGMNDYIVKPFNKEELIAKILTLCEK